MEPGTESSAVNSSPAAAKSAVGSGTYQTAKNPAESERIVTDTLRQYNLGSKENDAGPEAMHVKGNAAQQAYHGIGLTGNAVIDALLKAGYTIGILKPEQVARKQQSRVRKRKEEYRQVGAHYKRNANTLHNQTKKLDKALTDLFAARHHLHYLLDESQAELDAISAFRKQVKATGNADDALNSLSSEAETKSLADRINASKYDAMSPLGLRQAERDIEYRQAEYVRNLKAVNMEVLRYNAQTGTIKQEQEIVDGKLFSLMRDMGQLDNGPYIPALQLGRRMEWSQRHMAARRDAQGDMNVQKRLETQVMFAEQKALEYDRAVLDTPNLGYAPDDNADTALGKELEENRQQASEIRKSLLKEAEELDTRVEKLEARHMSGRQVAA